VQKENTVELTRREKALLRNHWRDTYQWVRVMADGSVEAKNRGEEWTRVETVRQAAKRLKAFRDGAEGGK
jgi:nitroimidazol reductase NimA-like FMN-containing flavoprotein (pyridoxamine 5'-phosphate oxidase superfamily)